MTKLHYNRRGFNIFSCPANSSTYNIMFPLLSLLFFLVSQWNYFSKMWNIPVIIIEHSSDKCGMDGEHKDLENTVYTEMWSHTQTSTHTTYLPFLCMSV